jgi:hypothetical protein
VAGSGSPGTPDSLPRATCHSEKKAGSQSGEESLCDGEASGPTEVGKEGETAGSSWHEVNVPVAFQSQQAIYSTFPVYLGSGFCRQGLRIWSAMVP